MRAAFFDELEKIGAARKFHVSKERKGRRSISVHNLLKREKDGTLYKNSSSIGTVVPFAAPFDANEARAPKRPGDLPSKEDGDTITRMDGRQEAATVHGSGTVLSTIGATNTGNY